MDTDDVQKDVVPEGTSLPEGEKPPESEKPPEGERPPEPQPLTKEEVQQMIAEATAQAREVGRREMQGIKDREVGEANRRARLAESRVTAYDTSFKGLDEETQKDVELARLRGESQYYQTFEQDEKQRREAELYGQRLMDSIVDSVKLLGIDPNDKRIDWAPTETDPLIARGKIDASVAQIVKDDAKVAETKLEERLLARIEADNLKNRVDAGLESHDKSASEGAGGDSSSRIANPDYVITQEDIKQAKKDGII